MQVTGTKNKPKNKTKLLVCLVVAGTSVNNHPVIAEHVNKHAQHRLNTAQRISKQKPNPDLQMYPDPQFTCTHALVQLIPFLLHILC